MTVADPPQATSRRSKVDQPGSNRHVTVDGVSWGMYVQLCDEIVRGGTRITYDRGRLEIVTPSQLHEQTKKIVARIVEAYGVLAGVPVDGLGSMTMRREVLDRGLEPDECYYIQNAAILADGHEIDLAIDPPPDLAIEIDIPPPDIAKQPIYAALGVPEVWRYDGRRVAYLARQADGRYAEVERSLALPGLDNGWVNDLLAIGLASGQSAAVAELARRMGN
jgi:Uma2 family endonuclease